MCPSRPPKWWRCSYLGRTTSPRRPVRQATGRDIEPKHSSWIPPSSVLVRTRDEHMHCPQTWPVTFAADSLADLGRRQPGPAIAFAEGFLRRAATFLKRQHMTVDGSTRKDR